MLDEESNQAIGTFTTRESIVALETRLQNLEVMLTNLTQHFLGGQNSNFQKQRRVEVGVEPRQPNIPQGNFKLHRNQLFKEDSSELLALSPSGQSHSLTNVREVVRVSADALQGFNLNFLPWSPRA